MHPTPILVLASLPLAAAGLALLARAHTDEHNYGKRAAHSTFLTAGVLLGTSVGCVLAALFVMFTEG